jgi:hypothetical protein
MYQSNLSQRGTWEASRSNSGCHHSLRERLQITSVIRLRMCLVVKQRDPQQFADARHALPKLESVK